MNLKDNLKDSILEQIDNFDYEFYIKNKVKKDYIFKGYVNRKLVWKGIKLEIKIRKYYDYKNHRSYYPIYKFLNINKAEKYDNETKNEAIKKVLFFNNTYKSAGFINEDCSMSKWKVFDCLTKYNDDFFEYDIKNFIPKKDKIFICIDDTFRKLKVKNHAYKFRFRVINIYQNKVDNKFENQIKICMIFKTNDNENSIKRTLKVIKDNLNKYYQFKQFKQKLIVCGDGANYINKIAKSLKSEQVLDKFHCYQNVFKVFNFKNLNRNLSNENAIEFNKNKKKYYYEIIRNLELKKFNFVYNLLDKLKLFFKEISKIIDLMRLKRYLKYHEQHIKNWELYMFNTTYTETYIQSIIKSKFGAFGKIYSLNIFRKIVGFKAIIY